MSINHLREDELHQENNTAQKCQQKHRHAPQEQCNREEEKEEALGEDET